MLVQARGDRNPSIGRVVICDDWSGSVKQARDIITAALRKYPKEAKTKFLMTGGGFLTFDLPGTLNGEGGRRNSRSGAVNGAIKEAAKKVDALLTADFVSKLRRHTRYLTLGVDSSKSKVSIGQNYITETHIELVAVVDLKDGAYYWTGKSYPTLAQKSSLIRIPNVSSHFFDSEFGKVAILGCHDLSMFNNRGLNQTGKWRKGVKLGFRGVAKRERPVYVLQHPHITDSHRIWYNSWKNLERLLPSVKEYASAIRYYREGGERVGLNEVLEKTKKGPVMDLVVLPRSKRMLRTA